MLSSLIIAFLPRNQGLLISWLQSPSAVILEPPKIKLVTVSTVFPSICHEVIGPDAVILVFWMLSLSQLFHSPLSLSRGSLVPLCFLPLKWYLLHIWSCWYISRQSWFQLVSHPAQHFTWCTLHGEDFPIAQTVKNLPVMQETRIQSLGQEDPLEKGMTTHSSIPAWRIPWTEEPGGL